MTYTSPHTTYTSHYKHVLQFGEVVNLAVVGHLASSASLSWNWMESMTYSGDQNAIAPATNATHVNPRDDSIKLLLEQKENILPVIQNNFFRVNISITSV